MGHFQQAPGVTQYARVIVDNKNAFFAGSQRRALHRFVLFSAATFIFFVCQPQPLPTQHPSGLNLGKVDQVYCYRAADLRPKSLNALPEPGMS
jgi:hypothetical protein